MYELAERSGHIPLESWGLAGKRFRSLSLSLFFFFFFFFFFVAVARIWFCLFVSLYFFFFFFFFLCLATPRHAMPRHAMLCYINIQAFLHIHDSLRMNRRGELVWLDNYLR